MNYKSVDVLGATWTKPAGKVDNYTVSITGAVNNTIQTNTTQVNFTGLLPGRIYTVTVQTVSGSCSQTSAPVIGATYLSDIGKINFETMGTNHLTLSWLERVNMTGVFKIYIVSYGIFPSTNLTVASTTTNVVLQNLISGTNYSISVVTVGVRGYQSLPVITSVYTRMLDQPNNITASLSGDLMDITFLPFDSSRRPIEAYAVIITTEMNDDRSLSGILSKTYNDFKNNQTNTYVTCIIEQRVTLRSVRSNEISVRVGDGNKTHSYVNGPLDPQSQYRVSIAGFYDIKYDPNTDTIIEEQSLVSFTNYTGSIISTTTTPPLSPTVPKHSDTGAIVGGVIGSLFGIFVFIGVGFWLWRNRKNAAETENYEDLFHKLQENNNLGFIVELDKLQSVGVLQPRSVALHPANAEKNREGAVHPYDKSRVKLSTLENSSDGYINANYVPGYTSEKEFIAAQHPLPGTIKDFWYMIWEKRINTIVMLSHSQENYKTREEEYWPTTEAKTFGNIIATFMSENIQSGWTVRDFMVTNVKNNESRQVRQFHFTEWHENGDMDERDVLIQFVYLVHTYKKENSSNCPTLVHCRTGAGRSGIFIALDCIINQLEGGNNVDVYGIVHKMYLHRPLMVQTAIQYIFLHRCTLDMVKGKENGIDDNHYETIIQERNNEEIPVSYYNVQEDEPYERAMPL